MTTFLEDLTCISGHNYLIPCSLCIHVHDPTLCMHNCTHALCCCTSLIMFVCNSVARIWETTIGISGFVER